MRIFQFLKSIDLITMLNVISGVLAMVYSIKGEAYSAVVFLFTAVIFDAIDGRVSRHFNRSTEFGKELDSLADIISFGVAPVIFVNSLTNQGFFDIIAFSFFLICGTLRLARFNISSKPYFEGMPITTNGIIIPLLFLLHLPLFLYPYIMLLLGLVMISDIKIKKLSKGK